MSVYSYMAFSAVLDRCCNQLVCSSIHARGSVESLVTTETLTEIPHTCWSISWMSSFMMAPIDFPVASARRLSFS